jgi:hypothetical protein
MTMITQTKFATNVAITIPGNGTTTGTQLMALIAAGDATLDTKSICGVIILAKQANSATDRAAFAWATGRGNGATAIAATDFTTHGAVSPAGADWYIPSDTSDMVYLRSLDASAVPAVAVVFLDPGGQGRV